jgi:hypothetical protein
MKTVVIWISTAHNVGDLNRWRWCQDVAGFLERRRRKLLRFLISFSYIIYHNITGDHINVRMGYTYKQL